MKKLAILIVIILMIIVLIFGGYLYFSSTPKSIDSPVNSELEEKILAKSSWTYLEKEDFYGYLNGTYTPAVQKIISSLENAVPVIFNTSNDKFAKSENNTFLVASAFNAQNKVYIYHYNVETSKYIKSLVSLENLLEDSNAVYIYDETEEI